MYDKQQKQSVWNTQTHANKFHNLKWIGFVLLSKHKIARIFYSLELPYQS